MHSSFFLPLLHEQKKMFNTIKKDSNVEKENL